MSSIADLETRIAKVELAAMKLANISAYLYMTLLSLPYEVQNDDPDFKIKLKQASEEIYSVLDVLKSLATKSTET